ncbi:MAG: hypothetical protein ACI9L9_001865 [Marivirga sp.]|jgi:hypothetical protein
MLQSQLKQEISLKTALQLKAELSAFQLKFLEKIVLIQQAFIGPAMLFKSYILKKDLFGTMIHFPLRPCSHWGIEFLSDDDEPDDLSLNTTFQSLSLYFPARSNDIQFNFLLEVVDEDSTGDYFYADLDGFKNGSPFFVTNELHTYHIRQRVSGYCIPSDTVIQSANFEALVFTSSFKLLSHQLHQNDLRYLGYFREILNQMLVFTDSWKMTLLYWKLFKEKQDNLPTQELFRQLQMTLKQYLLEYYGTGFYFNKLVKVPALLLKWMLDIVKRDKDAFQALYYSLTQCYNKFGYDIFDYEDVIIFHYQCQFKKKITIEQATYINYYYLLPFSRFVVRTNSFQDFLSQIKHYIHPEDAYDRWTEPKGVYFKLAGDFVLLENTKDFEFNLIKTNKDLINEGSLMRNCAGSFCGAVAEGRSVFYHVNHLKEKSGIAKKGYTLRLETEMENYYLAEVKAFANKEAPAMLMQQIDRQLLSIESGTMRTLPVFEPIGVGVGNYFAINYYQAHFEEKLTGLEHQIIKICMQIYHLPLIAEARCFADIMNVFEAKHPGITMADFSDHFNEHL